MAWDDFNNDYEVVPPDLNDVLFNESDPDFDQHCQDLFVQAVLGEDGDAYMELCEYLWDNYGIDFEELFEWDDFREWYGNN
jgi:hypothetical protein